MVSLYSTNLGNFIQEDFYLVFLSIFTTYIHENMLKFTIIVTLILSLLLALLPNILWLLLYLIGKATGFNIGYPPFGWSALALVILCWGLSAYGYFIGRWKLDINHVEYTHSDIPESFDGYRIVHISDLHLSTFDDNKGQLERIVDEINNLEPDLICFTGDMVGISPSEASPYLDCLKGIRSCDGVASVLGNHDFMLYSHGERSAREQHSAIDSLVNIQEKELGWRLLRNSNMKIERGSDAIHILGVDNTSWKGQGFQTVSKGDLKTAMTGSGGFRILLSHDPTHWTGEVVPDTDIQLTLSGHTHAAQICIFGWTPASWMFDQTKGRYDIDGQTLYINIGLGCTAPIRIGADPEITLITLRSKQGEQMP